MLTSVNDLRTMGKGKFDTSLSDSAVGLIISRFSDMGVNVIGIRDLGNHNFELATSHGTIQFHGSENMESLTKRLYNERYKFLNERFDKRVEKLKELGYTYNKEFHCFARGIVRCSSSGIPNAAIMHADDFMFNRYINIF